MTTRQPRFFLGLWYIAEPQRTDDWHIGRRVEEKPISVIYLRLLMQLCGRQI